MPLHTYVTEYYICSVAKDIVSHNAAIRGNSTEFRNRITQHSQEDNLSLLR